MSELVKMVRDAAEYPAPLTAEVHPDEVGNFAAGGWIVDDAQETAEQPPAPMAPDAIPADWSSRHWKQRVKLASEIAGRDIASAEEADAVIVAHLEPKGEVVEAQDQGEALADPEGADEPVA